MLNPQKAPGYDLITGELLQKLPRKAVVLLTVIYNSILRLRYFPIQWKLAQVTMIPKPGKPATQANSYRPISLLPIMSKVLERLLLHKIEQVVPINEIIPQHQFGFRREHSTIQQCHRIVIIIKTTLEEKKFRAGVFLDIQQAFDRVWQQVLLCKLKLHLTDQLYFILKSYLTDRYFQVKIEDNFSNYHIIQSGVPQGSVLGPFLYRIFTADVPTRNDTFLATFADDTGILVVDVDPNVASQKVQNHLDQLQNWLKRWKINVNASKSYKLLLQPENLHVLKFL